MHILGIDVGGSGIKGAPVDTQAGTLLAERLRIPTPDKAEPQPVAEVVAQIAQSFDVDRPDRDWLPRSDQERGRDDGSQCLPEMDRCQRR